MSLLVRTCEDAAPWLGALHDGELEPDERAAVERHLAGCAACRDELAALADLTALVHDVIPLPPADVWRTFDVELGAGLARAEPASAAPAGRVLRLGPILAAAAAVLVAALLPILPRALDPIVVQAHPSSPVPAALRYADPVRAAGPQTALVPDLEVEAIEAMTGLSRRDADALRRRLVVQVRAPGATRLSDLYPTGRGAPQAFITADVALALASAAIASAEDAVERDLLAPGLRALLVATLRELRALELATEDAALQAGARRAREVVGVAAVLIAADPALPRDSLARACAEAARVEAAAGVSRSLVLGRDVDYRAFGPWERVQDEDDLAPHRRAAAWLSRAGLRQDGQHPDDVRAAALLGMAVARARVPGRVGGEVESGLALLERLEAALEVLHGAPDALGPRQALLGACEVLGVDDAVALSALAPADVPGRLAARARVEALARGRERVRGPAADGDAPVVRLLGGTRGLEAEALTRLSAPALPDRGAPSALDILAVLGARRARTIVSAERDDAPGYDEALARVAEDAAAWRDPTRPVPSRACLEQGRLWAIAALLDEEAAPGGHSAWRDRRLLCALAALVPQSPSACAAPPAVEQHPGAPAPRVEPLPRVYARLAFTAGRIADAVDALVPTPRASLATARLRRAAGLLRALRDAASAELERRAPSAEVEAELATFGALLRELEPATVAVAEEVFVSERPGGARVLHRAVTGVDALWVIVVDPRTGAPRVVRGAALAPRVVWTEGARPRAREMLALEAARSAPPPAWATHLGGAP